MSQFIVTVKFAQDKNHNPQNKVKGKCPMPWTGQCSDSTGAHHSRLVKAKDERDVRSMFVGYHVTRVEEVLGFDA